MAKDRLNDPGYKTPYTDDERSPGGHGRGNSRGWASRGGRSIGGGPEPGERSGAGKGDRHHVPRARLVFAMR